MIPHGIPGKTWETEDTDMFTHNNNNYLWVVDYHSKFQIEKCTEELSADYLIKCFKVVFEEYGLPRRRSSDAGTNFI